MSDKPAGRRPRRRVALVLDEMHAPVVAETLRKRGHDVVSVAERTDLRAMPDEELFAWAAQEQRRLVTENVKDFRRLAMRGEEAGRPQATLLYTSSRSFPRSRHNPGPLVAALEEWLCRADAGARPVEDWLQPV